MSALVDALRAAWEFLPTLTFLLVCYLGWRLERTEERLAHARIDLMHLVELLHRTDTCSVRLRDSLARDWPELKLRHGGGGAALEPLGRERAS